MKTYGPNCSHIAWIVKHARPLIVVMAILIHSMAGANGDLPSPAPPPHALGGAVSDDTLMELAAREETTSSTAITMATEATVDGNLSDNTLTSNTTGGNVVSSGAFTNMNGIGTIIQNSGNQVLIQNSFILNVVVQ